jgi:hypothetical protein
MAAKCSRNVAAAAMRAADNTEKPQSKTICTTGISRSRPKVLGLFARAGGESALKSGSLVVTRKDGRLSDSLYRWAVYSRTARQNAEW